MWDGCTSVKLWDDCPAYSSAYRRELNTCPSAVSLGASFRMISQSSYLPELPGCKAMGGNDSFSGPPAVAVGEH